jgi:SSS family transporter
MEQTTYYWLVFGAYCFLMLYLGYLGMRKTKNANDYFIGGRTFGLWIGVPLFVATYITAGTMVGYTGFAYTNGWALVARYGIGLLCSMTMLQLFSRKFYNAKTTWYTTSDLLCTRFEDEVVLRPVLAGYMILNSLYHVLMGVIGVGATLEVFLGLPYAQSIILVGTIFVLYTAFGGMYSVAWTNVIQCILLFSCMVVAAWWGIGKVGGLGAANLALATINDGALLSFNMAGKYPMASLIGSGISVMLSVPCLGYYHRIFFSLKDKRTARSLIGFVTVFVMIVYFVVIMIGISGRLLLPDLRNPENVFPSLVMMMPWIVGGITVSGIIAAVQSSIDGQLLAASTMITHDFYQKRINPDATEKQQMLLSRNVTLICGFSIIGLALLRPAPIMVLYDFIVAINSSTLFPSLFLGLFWKRTTKLAANVGTIFGCLGGLAWYMTLHKSYPTPLVIIPASIVLMVLISFVTRPNSNKVLAMYFRDIPEDDARSTSIA